MVLVYFFFIHNWMDLMHSDFPGQGVPAQSRSSHTGAAGGARGCGQRLKPERFPLFLGCALNPWDVPSIPGMFPPSLGCFLNHWDVPPSLGCSLCPWDVPCILGMSLHPWDVPPSLGCASIWGTSPLWVRGTCTESCGKSTNQCRDKSPCPVSSLNSNLGLAVHQEPQFVPDLSKCSMAGVQRNLGQAGERDQEHRAMGSKFD